MGPHIADTDRGVFVSLDETTNLVVREVRFVDAERCRNQSRPQVHPRVFVDETANREHFKSNKENTKRTVALNMRLRPAFL